MRSMKRQRLATALARSLHPQNVSERHQGGLDVRMMLAALVLVLAACAHVLGAEPPRVRAEQQDAPAISPWAQPPPHASIEENGPSSGVPADSDQAP
jgi:hypothetical protein